MSHAVLGHPRQRGVMVESSDRMWSTGEGNGKLHKYSCLENPMNSVKKQKVMIPEDEPLRSGAQNATGEEQRAITNTPERRKQLGQCGHDA